jgi:hypothetical protein
MPLFDQSIFMQLYEQQYSPNPPPSPAWYATLNIVLALGSLTDSLGEHDSDLDLALDKSDEHNAQLASKRYFKNACRVFTELVFTTNSILAVQALLGIV